MAKHYFRVAGTKSNGVPVVQDCLASSKREAMTEYLKTLDHRINDIVSLSARRLKENEQ